MASRLPCKMPAGQKKLGKKIADTQAKRQAVPATVSAKKGKAMLGALMHKRSTRKG